MTQRVEISFKVSSECIFYLKHGFMTSKATFHRNIYFQGLSKFIKCAFMHFVTIWESDIMLCTVIRFCSMRGSKKFSFCATQESQRLKLPAAAQEQNNLRARAPLLSPYTRRAHISYPVFGGAHGVFRFKSHHQRSAAPNAITWPGIKGDYSVELSRPAAQERRAAASYVYAAVRAHCW